MAIKLQPARRRVGGLVLALLFSALLHLGLLWPALVARQVAPVSGVHMAALQVQIAVPQGVESPAQPPAAVAFSPRRERDSPGAPAKFRSIPAEAVAASPGRPGPGTEVPPAAGTEAAPDADSLRRYRWALALAAHELRPHHDELALAAGATVDLRVEHDARGLARAITVRQSSGHAATDSSARALVARAVDRVVLPVSLRGRAFAVDVSIDVRADE